MRVQVLNEATADLADWFRFYERQADGLGDYLLDSLWSDIQSLRLYGGIHAIHNGYYRLFLSTFLTQCTTALRMVLRAFGLYSTAVGIQSGYRNGLNYKRSVIQGFCINGLVVYCN